MVSTCAHVTIIDQSLLVRPRDTFILCLLFERYRPVGRTKAHSSLRMLRLQYIPWHYDVTLHKVIEVIKATYVQLVRPTKPSLSRL